MFHLAVHSTEFQWQDHSLPVTQWLPTSCVGDSHGTLKNWLHINVAIHSYGTREQHVLWSNPLYQNSVWMETTWYLQISYDPLAKDYPPLRYFILFQTVKFLSGEENNSNYFGLEREAIDYII